MEETKLTERLGHLKDAKQTYWDIDSIHDAKTALVSVSLQFEDAQRASCKSPCIRKAAFGACFPTKLGKLLKQLPRRQIPDQPAVGGQKFITGRSSSFTQRTC